jgi:hypothetical protein
METFMFLKSSLSFFRQMGLVSGILIAFFDTIESA